MAVDKTPTSLLDLATHDLTGLWLPSMGHAPHIPLLQAGADPNATNQKGDTPLHLCSSAELMAALLQASADPNATNKVMCRTFFCILP